MRGLPASCLASTPWPHLWPFLNSESAPAPACCWLPPAARATWVSSRPVHQPPFGRLQMLFSSGLRPCFPQRFMPYSIPLGSLSEGDSALNTALTCLVCRWNTFRCCGSRVIKQTAVLRCEPAGTHSRFLQTLVVELYWIGAGQTLSPKSAHSCSLERNYEWILQARIL